MNQWQGVFLEFAAYDSVEWILFNIASKKISLYQIGGCVSFDPVYLCRHGSGQNHP